MNVCFGIHKCNNTILINMIIILAKRHIYRCRVQETKINFQDFKEWVQYLQKIEKQIAVNKDKMVFHLKKWEPLL